MFKKIFAIMVAFSVMCTAVYIPTATEVKAAGSAYYVDAINGSDASGDGSSNSPWKSISKAAGVVQAGDTVKIRSGTYRETVTPANSGTAGNHITFEADTGADVTVSGADLVTSGWTVNSGNTYQTSTALGMGDWKNQVFVDGVSMNLARWPNSGTEPMNQVFNEADSGTNNSKIVDSELTQPDGYWDGAAVVAMDKFRWGIASAIVTSYTTGQLNLGSISTYGLGVSSNGYGSPYFILGKLAALDSGNEWYYDSGSTTLYLQTPGSDNPADHSVEVKARDLAFNLDSKNYIRIKGVKLFASTLDTRTSNFIEIDGINVKYPSHYELTHTGSSHNWLTSGILLGGTGNILKNSTVAYSPGNLITLSGENNQVVNNLLHDAAYGPFYTTETSNVVIRGNGHLISHNTMYNSGRAIMSGVPQNSRIQYNHAYNAMQLLDDGAFMYFGYTDGNGTEIHHNYFHDAPAFSPPHNIVGGIYLDHGVSNFKVYNNVVSNIPSFGVFLHHYNEVVQVYNNTFYNKSRYRMKDDGGALDAYGVRVINNIAYDNFRVAPGFGVYDTNNFKSGDPLFADPANEDFTLQSGSEAIDAGMEISGITDGFSGSAPDIGAFESEKPLWTVGHDFNNHPNPNFTTVETRYTQQLFNGFFELDRNEVGGWTKTGAQTAIIERSQNSATSSRYAWTWGLKLGTGADGVEQTVTGLQPNTEYELRGFGRAAVSGQEIRIGVKGYSSADTYEAVTSTSWTKKKIRFTTGSTDTSATIYINKPTSGGFAFADDITLIEVDPNAPTEQEFDSGPIDVEPGVTVVNDRETGTGLNQFEFVGNWMTGNNIHAYQGDVTFSQTTNDYYQVRFEGEQILLYSEKAAHMGIVAVSIDGGPETLIDLYSSTQEGNELVYTSPELTSGQHILKVRLTGTKNASASGTWHVADRVDILSAPIVVNDRETGTDLNQFEFVGNWMTGNNIHAYQGDVTFSQTTNDYYQVRFEGKQIKLYSEKAAHMGIVGVSIDGGAETLIDLYAAEQEGNVLVYTSPELAAGQHILKVRITGTKNASAGGTWHVADRVDIVGAPAAGEEPEPVIEYVVIIWEDFESTSVGAVPNGWTFNTTDNEASVTEDASGNRTLTVAESANSITTTARLDFTPLEGLVRVEMKFMAEQVAKHANFLTLLDQNGTKVLELLTENDYDNKGRRHIARRTAAGWTNILQYNAYQWYDIRLDIDTEARTYDIWIDGNQFEGDVSFLNAASDIATYRFASHRYDQGTYHVDDLRISHGIEAQPDPEPPVMDWVDVVWEDFESTAVGQIPDGWTAGMADSEVKVTQASGNNRLTVAESGNGKTSFISVNFDPLAGQVRVELRAMAQQIGNNANFLALFSSSGTKVVELLFDTNSSHTSKNISRRIANGGWIHLQQYIANQWYDFQVDLNTETSTYDVWIDGSLIAEAIPFVGAASDIARYTFSSYRWDKGTYNVDDVRISHLTEVQQAIPVSEISVSSENGDSYIRTIGGTLQMVAAVEPDDATEKSVTWTVVGENGEATDAATVNQDGLVTVHEDGIVKIIATANDGFGAKGESTVIIDTIPPVIETPEQLTFLQIDPILVQIAATDNLSGVETLEVSFRGETADNPFALDPLSQSVGEYQILVTAIDRAGHRSDKEFTLVVMMDIDHLDELIAFGYDHGWISNAGIRTSLLTHVKNIQREHDKGRADHVHNMLEAMTNFVKAQKGKHIDEWFATIILEDLEYISNSIGN